MGDRTVPRIPIATYRLQFREGMTFDRAVGLIPHWKSLGISHLYASPIFAAVSGSTHGYDVTDPNVIDPALGGAAGFVTLSKRLEAAGIGLVLDIVPNHMAASLENPHWRSVLKFGRRSPSAPIFDQDWDQKISLPVLTAPLCDEIEAGHGKLVGSATSEELVFDYRGSAYPLDPSTYPRDVTAINATAALALLGRQPWQMIPWRDARKGLSYRRFFEITGLVGVRVEDPAVFDAMHDLILRLVAEGRVKGLRIDHIDGLADPTAYLQRLRQAVGPDLYVVVEKILEGDEQLPRTWPVEGTTGYEFIADMAGLLSTESPEPDRGWRDMAPEFGDPEQELARAKRLMVDVNFEGEVQALVGRAMRIALREGRSDIAEAMMAEAVRMLVAGFDVYRTYGTARGLDEQDIHVLEALFGRLSASADELQPALSFLEDALFTRLGEQSHAAAIEFRTRLQHLTGPVLAKSLEDTFFYRYNRLIALNEVGGDPIGRAGGIDHFHRRMIERTATQPHALSATSTHDTKRGEDARARLYAISEAPDDWNSLVRRWRKALASNVATLNHRPAPEPAVEWLLFQALAGMLPPDFEPRDDKARRAVLDRFVPYIEKALREAKLRTSWSQVNEGYERAARAYAAAAIRSQVFMTGYWRDIRPFVRTGLVNSLVQTLLKLTAPGVPDIYQGTEGYDMSLVDPDNRRMPDYRNLVIPKAEPAWDDFTATKTWLIATVLNLRRSHIDLFTEGDYVPLESTGIRKGKVIAFARRRGHVSAITVTPRLVHHAVSSGSLLSRDYWGDTAIDLPSDMRMVRDALGSSRTWSVDGRFTVADVFRRRPFMLLMAET